MTVLLIPAYQPDEKLTALLRELDGRLDAVVVDDGSGKNYDPVFEACAALDKVSVIRYEKNRGKGGALKTGFEHISEAFPGCSVITADADGQHTIKDILAIAARLGEMGPAMVLGVRQFQDMPARSKAGNTITRFVFRLATGFPVTDTQTGLRGFSPELIPWLLKVEGERYEYEMNMLLTFKETGFEYGEIPISTVYIDNNISSHFNTVRDGFLVFSRVLKYLASSAISTLVDFGLYWLLMAVGLWAPWTYIIARVVSAILNYELNLRAVFHTKASVQNVVGYFLLAAAVMVIGSAAVTWLTSLGASEAFIKLPVDFVLFIANYFIQKKVIFKKK